MTNDDKAVRSTRPAADAGWASADDGRATGVATGSLGTAANLEDTQAFSTAELRAAAARAEGGQPRRQAHPSPAPAVAQPVRRAPPTARPRRASGMAPPQRDHFAGLAGVLAVVFLALAGAVFVLLQNGQPTRSDEGAAPTPTAVPAAQQPKDDGDKGKGHGNGRGNGNGNEDD